MLVGDLDLQLPTQMRSMSDLLLLLIWLRVRRETRSAVSKAECDKLFELVPRAHRVLQQLDLDLTASAIGAVCHHNIELMFEFTSAVDRAQPLDLLHTFELH